MNRETFIKELESRIPGIDFVNETHLVTNGFVDSLAIIMIMVVISEVCGVDIPLEEMDAKNFESVDTMLLMIERAQNS